MFANPEILADAVGLMAGFVFASIILLVSNPPKDRPVSELSPFLLELVVVGLGFTISALLFAFVDLRLEQKGFERAFLMLLMASCIGTLAVVQMYHGLAWLFWAYGVESSVVSKVGLVFRATTLLLSVNLIYMIGNLSGKIEAKVFGYLREWHTFIWTLPFFALFLLTIPAVRNRLGRLNALQPRLAIQWITMATLMISIGIAIYAGIVFGLAMDVRVAFGSAGKYVVAFIVGSIYCAFEATLPSSVLPSNMPK